MGHRLNLGNAHPHGFLATGSVLATSSDALLLVARTLLGAPGIATRSKDVISSFLLLVAGPGAPSSALAPSSDALCSVRSL